MKDTCEAKLGERDSPLKRTTKKATRSKGPSVVVEGHNFRLDSFPIDGLNSEILKASPPLLV